MIHVVGTDECGLARTADSVAYLATQSAGQCGPCVNGLPRLAGLLDDLAYGRSRPGVVERIRQTVGLVDGRGSCRHPDGTARLVRSALDVFAGDIALHSRRPLRSRTPMTRPQPRYVCTSTGPDVTAAACARSCCPGS